MKRQMKIFIMWTSILTFLGCGLAISKKANDNKIGQTNETEQYVSMNCQTGDITLTLNPDMTFNLIILFWDSKTNQHTGQEIVKGNWTKDEKRLTLITSDNNKIIYDSKTTNMKIGNIEINAMTYGFISNDKAFFGTSFDLLEKGQTDKFLLEATKQKK
jgi:hypothetical protein